MSTPQHSLYEPFPWIRWLRAAQTLVNAVVFGLCVYVATVFRSDAKLSYTFFTIVWTAVWLAVVSWGIPRMQETTRPNIVVIVIDSLACLWWLVATALLGYYSSATYFYYCYYDGYGDYDCGYYYTTDVDDVAGSFRTAWESAKAATAFAAINFVLFAVTLVATCIRARQQKKQRASEAPQGAGLQPRLEFQQAETQIVDKPAQVHAHEVQA